jgi:chromosome segregation ATPase
MMYPSRDVEDATVELHRLRAELSETAGKLRMEQTRQKVNGLSDAERTALNYKVEQLTKDLEAEQQRNRDQAETFRKQVQSLQDRIDSLALHHDEEIRAMAAAEKQHIANVEEALLRREEEMKIQFEAAVRERDRKLQKAATHISTLEQQYSGALAEIENLRALNTQVQTQVAAATQEKERQLDQFRRLKLQFDALETHNIEIQQDLKRFEEQQRTCEREVQHWRSEAARWKREVERFSSFTLSLQTELKQLDEESTTAADLLRLKVLRERSNLR